MNIPVYKPFLTKNSLKYAYDAINSTWISSHGKYISIVEEKLQELLNIKYVLPVNNGTSACHLLAKCLSKKYNKSKIIVPNNVYVAAWNAFLFDNNYDLISVDCDLNTWNYDLEKLEKTILHNPDAAVLIVHNIGNIINVPQLKNKYPNTIFVEDNCEGFLGKYDGLYSGTASYASSISFFGNKTLTSGEGGAFLTNDEETYLFAKCIQGQGQSSKRFVHNELGYNYRMTNIQAAILCGQLEVMSDIIEMKNDIFTKYRNVFDNRDDVKIQLIENGTEHSNWMFGIRIIGNPVYEQAEVYFNAHNIEIRPMFYSINEHAHLKNNPLIKCENDTNAILLNKECFILPSYPELKNIEVKHIIKTANNYVKSLLKKS